MKPPNHILTPIQYYDIMHNKFGSLSSCCPCTPVFASIPATSSSSRSSFFNIDKTSKLCGELLRSVRVGEKDAGSMEWQRSFPGVILRNSDMESCLVTDLELNIKDVVWQIMVCGC